MARRTTKGRRNEQLKLENLEDRHLLAADLLSSFGDLSDELAIDADQSEEAILTRADVDQDDVIGPLDVLAMINELNGTLRNDGSANGNAGQFDLNGDGRLSPLDVMMAINRMGQRHGDGATAGGNNHGHNHGQMTGDDGMNPGDPRPPLPIRSIDGTNNNRRHADWGSTDEALVREGRAEYADGVSEPAGADRISAREISNLVAAQSESVLNDRGLSDFVWQWGQFIDHDIDLTEAADSAESFDIEVPAGDAYFDPSNSGSQTIGLTRSNYTVDGRGVRQQVNQITAFIDGSNVYGSDAERAAALRTFVGGQLRTSDGNLLPFNEAGLDNAGGPSDALFLAGDVRANEQVGLTAMHTLWVREHNRIVVELAARDPRAIDEQLYQRARAIVIGEIQAITYNEFLPALLGRGAIERYDGYDRRTDPGIGNLFSTAAYRFGHSMLSPELLRLNSDGTTADEGALALREAFFHPDELTENGIDSLLVGLANQTAQEIDTHIVDDVRNFLFGAPGSGGFDLAALNIQRGRDHGLPSYNQAREEFGLEPVTRFDEVTSDPELQSALAAAYDTVDDIDAWVGGLAEDHVRGSSVGELIQSVLVDQFTRLRDGDRFWYQRIFQGRDLRMIESTRLSDVIERNTEITGLEQNVFVAPRPPFHNATFVGSGVDGAEAERATLTSAEPTLDSLITMEDTSPDDIVEGRRRHAADRPTDGRRIGRTGNAEEETVPGRFRRAHVDLIFGEESSLA